MCVPPGSAPALLSDPLEKKKKVPFVFNQSEWFLIHFPESVRLCSSTYVVGAAARGGCGRVDDLQASVRLSEGFSTLVPVLADHTVEFI